ncbi:hypothetical protein GJ654_10410 [Rhodoblastus acidophilus]|uniref:Uncharacterized protein n=1 Tax=Rhodoblastus acidophilus TaxID=1074 RepID=A0A6N8DNH9_RHOAC|nr:hypothetical protein [Rhodoblastus acidophilus]MCW2275137.1 hypothetical protein [Rhodoblastus acidophilus]MTV31406.1 hypothetical protein [Rhodoblastus acidophilus]
MSIFRSLWAKFKRSANMPYMAGLVTQTDFYYELTDNLGIGDVVDLGVLPSNARIVDAHLFAEGDLTGKTVTVGFLTGTPGDTVGVRNLTGDLFSAQALDAGVAITRLNKAPVLNATPSATDQSIGLQFSAAVAPAAGKKVHLRLFYAQ